MAAQQHHPSMAPGGMAHSPRQAGNSLFQQHVQQHPGQIPQPIHLQAAGPVPPPSTVDITLSPTYQLIQEMEIGRDHAAISDQQYVINTPEAVNYGRDCGAPTQSGSFNALMSSLLSHPRV